MVIGIRKAPVQILQKLRRILNDLPVRGQLNSILIGSSGVFKNNRRTSAGGLLYDSFIQFEVGQCQAVVAICVVRLDLQAAGVLDDRLGVLPLFEVRLRSVEVFGDWARSGRAWRADYTRVSTA